MNVAAKVSTLSAEQIAFRSRVIGGSDANTIMSGDPERVMRLWREKRGEIEREDLSGVLPVRMGIWTEALNIQWFEEQTGRIVTHSGEECLSIDDPFMACTLDGLTDAGKTVFEAKHVNAFSKDDEIRARYMPQLQHNMHVKGLSRAVMSVFFGTMKWVVFDVEADPLYQAQLIDIERHFWHCVETGEPPIAQTVAAPVEAIRTADMTGRNEWAASAADWLTTREAAAKNDKSAKALKQLVEADVIRAFGHGVEMKRDARGALRLSATKE